jgi:hypothetical protein
MVSDKANDKYESEEKQMEMMKIMQAITNGKGGQFRSITWERQLKAYKGLTDIVTKKTIASALRMGVAYDNKSAVIEKRENGELPSENQGLNGYKWIMFPYILESIKSGSLQLRVTTANNTKYESHYYLNGKEVSKEKLNGIALASELQSSGTMADVFNLKIENILEIK